MEIKKIIIFFLLLCITSVGLFSQEESANYYIERENGEPRFKQRLSWRGDENAFQYEVIIEKNENGSFIPHAIETTSSRFLIVSLPHGDYRFRVIPYDIFDIAGLESAWRHIEVRKARQPRLQETAPEVVLSEDGSPSGFTLIITGDNIDPDAEIFLVYPDNTRTAPDIVEYDDEGNVIIFIDTTELEEGEYDVLIRNPGGLEASVGRAVVNNVIDQITEIRERLAAAEHDDQKQEKIFYFRAGLSWMPVIPLYSYDSFILTNFGFNLNFIFKMPLDFYLGPEIMFGNFYQFDEFILGVNILAEKWTLNERIIIGFRAGAGNVISSQTENIPIFLNMGASISWRFVRYLILDIGINYVHFFIDNGAGNLIPWIGFKFQI